MLDRGTGLAFFVADSHDDSGLCIDMCTDMCTDMRIDMCVGMCI